MIRRLLPAALTAIVLVSCARGPAPLAIIANAPGTFDVGQPQRLMVALVEAETSEFIAAPDLVADAIITDPSGAEETVATEFVWTVPDVVGIYLVRDTFEQSGTWWVRLKADGMAESMQASFIVGAGTDPMPGIGEQAVAVETRTTADHDLETLTTDDEPDPRFYTTSLQDALASGDPTVLVFATPAFCQSQTCGPMLDQVKAVANGYPEMNFVHVEIYENAHTATIEDLRIDPAVTAWGLPSEPWVFVIDEEGLVVARFEGTLQEGELDQALASLDA